MLILIGAYQKRTCTLQPILNLSISHTTPGRPRFPFHHRGLLHDAQATLRQSFETVVRSWTRLFLRVIVAIAGSTAQN